MTSAVHKHQRSAMEVVRALVLLLLFTLSANTCSTAMTASSTAHPELSGEEDAVAGRGEHSASCKKDGGDTSTTCPTWTFPTANNTCKCGSSFRGEVECDQSTLRLTVLGCYCVTYDTHHKKPVVGSCFYGCKYYPSYTLPTNISEVNHATCGVAKRSGQLCGGCQDGYAPPAYSYLLRCVRCSEGESNVGKYVAVSLLPLTVFYIAIAISGFSATVASLNAFILACQIIANPALMRIAESQFTQGSQPDSIVSAFNGVASVYGVWCLDFFRTLYKPFCLHHKMNTLQVLAMDYIVAIYPLVLTMLIYFLVKIYDCNFRVIVWVWRPFHWCLLHFKKQWNIRTSLIDTFATFLLLSCSKFLFVSVDLLTFTHVADMHGNQVGTFLYYDGTVSYFGTLHVPFAALAITIALVFAFLPSVLLCLYPCRCFQRILNRCGCRCFVLHAFMDAFQGCYKDGTNGTKDCRYFAGVYFWVRIILLMMYCLITGPVFYSSATLILTIVAAMFIVVKPYKTAVFNVTDPLLFFVLIIGNVTVLSTATEISRDKYACLQVIAFVVYVIPLLYLLAVAFHRFFVKTRIVHHTYRKFRSAVSREPTDNIFVEESLPDRLVHEDEYRPLLPGPAANWMQNSQ